MIEMTDHCLDVLPAEESDGPVVMLDLLRFRSEEGRGSCQRHVDGLCGGWWAMVAGESVARGA